jgi:hypothetical protein
LLHRFPLRTSLREFTTATSISSLSKKNVFQEDEGLGNIGPIRLLQATPVGIFYTVEVKLRLYDDLRGRGQPWIEILGHE